MGGDLDPDVVREHLQRAGVHVHHVAQTAAGDFVVYLEANRSEHDQARTSARRLPGVTAVVFAPSTNAIMYVSSL
jgi:hypothetical protein